jgi:hypothetical protein
MPIINVFDTNDIKSTGLTVNGVTVLSGGATSPLIAQATLLIYNAGNLEYSNSTEGVPFAGLLHNYTATGNGTISASSSEF